MYQFAIIGCGRISKRHAENIQKVGRLKAICDIIPERADQLAREFDCTAYYNIDDLLKAEAEVDIVSVCTPNGYHAEHSIKSLQAGKHVLCEKPMCLTSAAAWQMVETAHFFRRKLFVVKQNRYNEPVAFVKKALNDNKLGRILSFQINCFWNRPQEYYTGDWKGTTILDGGILYTQFSHFIDLLYWFLGDTEKINGFRQKNGIRTNIEVEDSGVAILKMKNGALGTLHFTINSFNKNMEGSFTLFGEKGTIKIGGQYLNELEWYEIAEGEKPVLKQKTPPNEYGFYQGSMSNHDKVYLDLVHSLHGNGNLLEAKDAAKTIEIIEKIYKATELE
jgi:predicted dehydrogenase